MVRHVLTGWLATRGLPSFSIAYCRPTYCEEVGRGILNLAPGRHFPTKREDPDHKKLKLNLLINAENL